MTRHRRGNSDRDEGDAPWRGRDYEPARQPDSPRDYFPPPWEDQARGAQRPPRGALGTSSGRDDGPGETTGPPWDLPGWDDSQPMPRAPRPGGLPGGHPSGPLPRVADSWPGSTGPPDPLAPLPPDMPDWPGSPGGGYPGGDFAGRHSASSGYPPDPYPGEEGPGYGREAYPGRHDDAPYLRTGYPDTGYGDADQDPDYGGTDSGYRGYGEPATDAGGYGPGYADEPGYGGDFRGGDYPGAGDYPDEGYPPDERYPAENGYGRDGGYGQVGYPGEEAGYLAEDEYPGGGASGRLREHEGDRGYDEPGDWYGDADDDEDWADDDEGFVPGLTSDADTRRPRAGGPGPDRARRPGGSDAGRPRGGGGKGRRGPMRRAAPWIALSVLVVLLAAVGVGGYYFYRNYLHPPDYSGPGTGSVTVHITSGETATDVGAQLLKLGVVASVRAFSNAAKASGHGSSLEPGYYKLHKHMAAALAFALLLKPSSRVQLTWTVPEGLRLYETIDLLGKDSGNLAGYQQAAKDISQLGLPSYAKGNPEGYLFPATYTVQPGTPPLTVLKQMVQRFNQQATHDNLIPVAKHDKVSPGDIIITASLVQAEGRTPKDMAKIARVIYNRLNYGMKLQLDSTVLYARHSRAHFDTVAQTLNTKSPYNTYLHPGLPPGAIDDPGAVAINAALHPYPGHHDWLYFVTVNPSTGQTKFTSSYAQFKIWNAQLQAYLAKHG